MEQELKFPKGFKWGSATASVEIEANGKPLEEEGLHVWSDLWLRHPEEFYNKQYVAGNWNEKFDEDIKIAKGLNFDSIRTSITWSRLMPDGINVSEEGVDYYNRLFDSFDENGIEMILTLNHIDMPMWAVELGGFHSREVIDKFVKFSKVVYKHWGDRIEYFEIFNEPKTLAHRMFISGDVTPKRPGDWKGYIKTIWGQNVASSKVIKAWRELGFKGKIGNVIDVVLPTPKTNSQADRIAADLYELFSYRGYLDTMIHGEFPKELIEHAKQNNIWDESMVFEGDVELFKEYTIDHIGVNNYSTYRVMAPDHGLMEYTEGDERSPFWQTYEKEGVRMNVSRGWEVRPCTLYEILIMFRDKYNNLPVFIGENGMGIEREDRYRSFSTGMIIDDYRIEYIRENLYWVHRAISAGCEVFGYHQWTYIDNWSWKNAYKNRYGYIELVLETGERKEKLSASWIRGVAKSNSIKIDPDLVPDLNSYVNT